MALKKRKLAPEGKDELELLQVLFEAWNANSEKKSKDYIPKFTLFRLSIL